MKKLTSILLLSLLTFAGLAQSPKATATGKIGETAVTVSYCQPAVKGRKIWGDLVPYGQVWRTGANDATLIEFSNDVMIEGKKLAKGKYAMFTIPTEKNWTIVFSPSPSMSSATRETKCRSRSTRCAGQTNPPVQRTSTSPSSATDSEPHSGQ